MEAMLRKLAHRKDGPRTETTDISRWLLQVMNLHRNTKRFITCEDLLCFLLTPVADSEFDEKEESGKTEGHDAESAGEGHDEPIMHVPVTDSKLVAMPRLKNPYSECKAKKNIAANEERFGR